MTASKAIVPEASQRTMVNAISVISLDALRPADSLVPGEPREIASGVTISVMQSAAEALLEIQENAHGTISIDNSAAYELTTVRPGQIIKTVEGRYVLIRHLRAIIVPRDPGYKRPDHVERMIELAMASLDRPLTEVVDTQQDTALNAALTVAPFRLPDSSASKGKLSRAVLGLAAAMLLGLCFVRTGKESVPATPGTLPDAKSRVIAAVDQTQAGFTREAGPQPTMNVGATPLAGETTQPVANPAPRNATSVDALKTARVSTPAVKKVPEIAASADTQAIAGLNSRGVRLNEKDRQTIIEYKLEAKFDRAKARVRLKDMAKTFPAGSPARADVERALSSM